jgi:hypothetical protein
VEVCGLWGSQTSLSMETGWHILTNDGSGTFSSAYNGQSEREGYLGVGSIAYGNFDNHLNYDYVVGGLTVWAGTVVGAPATYSQTLDSPFRNSSIVDNELILYGITRLYAGDVDGDGDTDIFAARAGENWLYLNDGTGVFERVPVSRYASLGGATTAVAALVDLDGDGVLDIIAGGLQADSLSGALEYHASNLCGTGARLFGSIACASPPNNAKRIHKDIFVECPPNEGRNLNDETQCQACSPGSGRDVGARQCGLCAPGTFSDGSGAGCLLCEAGSYANHTGSITCFPCAPGTYTDLDGQGFCTACPAGTHSRVGANSLTTQCARCPKGFYCPEGSSEGTKCPFQGSTTVTDGATSSADCVCRAGTLLGDVSGTDRRRATTSLARSARPRSSFASSRRWFSRSTRRRWPPRVT